MSSMMRLGSAVVLRSNCFSTPSAAPWLRVMSTTSSSSPASPPPAQSLPGETFFDKNKRLNRPMSPHLTIYKPQLTSILSVTHRGTGIALSVLLSGFGIGMLALPATYPYYVGLLAQSHFGGAIIASAKFSLAFPFMFHMFNGMRHLTWDMGYGFSLRDLYKSGYGVVALAIVSSLLLAAY